MEVTIEQVALRLKVYEGSVMRLSEYLGIQVYDLTVDSRIGSKAILTDHFVNFLEDNANFYKKYHDDYHTQKTPLIISKTINRDLDMVNEFLINRFPDSYENGIFKESAKKNLKYVSSYEIDFRLGNGNRINMNSLGRVAWHLGFKQQMIIDQMKADARQIRNQKGAKIRTVFSA